MHKTHSEESIGLLRLVSWRNSVPRRWTNILPLRTQQDLSLTFSNSFSVSTRQVVMAIVESGKNMSAEQKKTDRCPLLYEWHKKQYIGAAHGMAGIYYMLMQVRNQKRLKCSTGWLLVLSYGLWLICALALGQIFSLWVRQILKYLTDAQIYEDFWCHFCVYEKITHTLPYIIKQIPTCLTWILNSL